MVVRVVGCLSLLLAAGVLAGCAGAYAGDRVAAPAASAPPGADEEQPALDPLDLIGSWLVTEADEEPGVVLRIAEDIMLWRACGVQLGQWEAEGGGLFVAGMDSWTGECSAAQRRTDWLDESTSYRVTAAGVLLTGADGVVRAHLVPGGRPTPHPNISPELAEPPEVTDRDRSYRVRPAPAPLPEGVLPATREQLIGRWVPAEGSGLDVHGPTYVELGADGRWHGSHGEGLGCPSAGRWVVGSDGRLLSTTGPVPAVLCPGISVANWFRDASRAGIAAATDEVLVLFDAEGAQTGRLTRSP